LFKSIREELAVHFNVRGIDRDLVPTAEAFSDAVGQDVDGLIISLCQRMTADVIARLPPRVRVLATYSSGTDHIDMDAATARGIAVLRAVDAHAGAVADIAMLLILAVARCARQGDLMVRSGAWKGWSPTFLLGSHLGDKRLGIVGMGRIGQALALRARAFGLRVSYCGPRARSNLGGIQVVHKHSLFELLPETEILALCCPLTQDTRRMVNASALDRLPDGAILINVARGELIDDQAVLEALHSHKLAGAGLDVFANEPAIHPSYRTAPNVFLLPHVGSATLEVREAMGQQLLSQLLEFFCLDQPSRPIATADVGDACHSETAKTGSAGMGVAERASWPSWTRSGRQETV
jgi:lactate dehydrogenase-like 2-hydroxyacid dehydrogenase